MTIRLVTSAALTGTIALALACGGSSSNSGSPTSPSGACGTSIGPTTITISNNTVCPQNLTISRGQQVTFVNNDSRAHEMNSDPHPEHTDCPELNQVGHLEPGQQRPSGNLNTARRCGFHDHLNDQLASMKGTITIQ